MAQPPVLLSCPNPWCLSHRDPVVPFTKDDVWQLHGRYRVQCPECPICGPHAETPSGAIDAWNARAGAPAAVEQRDRDAAADLLDEISNLLDHNGIGQVADLIRDGEYDEHEATQAFVRHRLPPSSAQVGTRPQGQDGEAGLGRSPSDAVGCQADAPEPLPHTTKGI